MASYLALTEPESFAGTNVLQFCVFNPMRIPTIPGRSHDESLRFMLLDIRDFLKFLAFRAVPQKQKASWEPSFHQDSLLYTINILPPEGEPHIYDDFDWKVKAYETRMKGVRVEFAKESDFQGSDGKWYTTSGQDIRYVNHFEAHQ